MSTLHFLIIHHHGMLKNRVVPEVVSFLSLNEEKTFDVTVVGTGLPDGSRAVSALLVWSDGTYPLVVYTT